MPIFILSRIIVKKLSKIMRVINLRYRFRRGIGIGGL